MRHLFGLLAAMAVALGATAQVTGVYEGALVVAADAQLPLVVKLWPGRATLDSPSQNATDIPMEVLWQRGDSVSLRIPQIGLEYQAVERDGGLKGRFKQGVLEMALTLKRTGDAPEATATSQTRTPRRQDPQPPFPYSMEEVTLEAGPQVHLAGTLTVPAGYSPASTPVVVMITGSGLQTRDEEVAGHRPFEVLADALARRGIASLRYDDRGIGASTGPVADATTADFAADAAAWMPLLRSQGFARVGALGHSEGARIAAGLPGTDFIVALGLPALRGDSVLVAQNRAMLRQSGVDEAATTRYCDALAVLLSQAAAAGAGPDDPVATAQNLTLAWPSTQQDMALAGNLMQVARTLGQNRWLMHFIADSPAADIAAIRVPALAVYGANDVQVTQPENADAVRRLNPGVKVSVHPGLNHMLQPSATGNPAEYGAIDTTIDEGVITEVADFILNPR